MLTSPVTYEPPNHTHEGSDHSDTSQSLDERFQVRPLARQSVAVLDHAGGCEGYDGAGFVLGLVGDDLVAPRAPDVTGRMKR